MRLDSPSKDEAGPGVGHDEFVGHLFLHSSDESRAAAVHGDEVVGVDLLEGLDHLRDVGVGRGAGELLLRKKRLRLLKLGSLAVSTLAERHQFRVVGFGLLLIS